MKISSLSLLPYAPPWKQKEKEYKEAEQALNNNRTESKTYGTLAENARQSTARALRSYNLARTDAQAKCAQCNGIGLSTTTGETLKKLLEENKLEADKLNEKLTEVQKLSAQIITLQRQKDECQKHVDAARQAFNSADKVLNELKNSIVNYESLTANEKENIRATMDRVTPLILWEGWNTEWENSPLSFIDRLTQATRNYRLAQEKQRELKSAIALIHKELEGININKESIDAAFPDWRNAPAATQEMEIKDLGIAWNNLNTQASGLKQSISSTADQMARLQKDLTGFYAANPTLDEERITVLSAWSGSRIEALRASLQTLKEEEVAASTAFHLATEQMEEHIGRKPEIEENENFETLDALIANLEEKDNRRQPIHRPAEVTPGRKHSQHRPDKGRKGTCRPAARRVSEVGSPLPPLR